MSDYIELSLELQQCISSEEANHFSIIPKLFTGDETIFYFDNSRLTEIQEIEEELRLLLDKPISLIPTDSDIIKKSLAIYYRKGKDIVSETIISNDFLENLIISARKLNASDIHIEIYSATARVRLRIDGTLIEKSNIELHDYAELVNQIKIKSRLNITEKRLPQDGRIEYDNFDIRVSILPTHYGENIVMRILGKDASNLDIKKLGMGKVEFKTYMQGVQKPNGIILISGPTGSGKTTTLYATLKHLNNTTQKIVTVEDPIEYTLKGINQVQLREDIGLTFTSALRSFLRQDPDIIMLGEIRDAQTAQMAIRASLTGHLVLSTIHTNSAIGTLSRLEDMGVPPFLIAETLNLSVAQRLIRLLCPNCKQKTKAKKQDFPNSFHEKFSAPDYHYIAKGCASCHFTGYVGRRAIYEVLDVTNTIAQDIKQSNYNKIESAFDQKKLVDSAYEVLIQGESTLEEVYPFFIQV